MTHQQSRRWQTTDQERMKPVWVEVLEAALLLGIAGAAIVLVITWLMLASLHA